MTDAPGRIADWIESRGRFVALVGAGGKTTLMYALAQEMAARGRTCIITTTTHIWRPDFLPLAEDLEALRRLRNHHRLVVYGRPGTDGKLSRPPDWDAGELQNLAEYVWAEADGSRGLPCKAPSGQEPVIPGPADVVLGIAGLQALDKPIAQICCRPGQVQALLRKPGDAAVSAEDIARILCSPQGARKNVGGRHYAAVLSQCTGRALRQCAQQIREMLAEQGVPDVFCMSRFHRKELND